MKISEIEQKIKKIFFVAEIIAFELVVVNYHYYEENTCHRQSMC